MNQTQTNPETIFILGDKVKHVVTGEEGIIKQHILHNSSFLVEFPDDYYWVTKQNLELAGEGLYLQVVQLLERLGFEHTHTVTYDAWMCGLAVVYHDEENCEFRITFRRPEGEPNRITVKGPDMAALMEFVLQWPPALVNGN